MKNVWGNGVIDEMAVLIIGIGSIILTAVGKMDVDTCKLVWLTLLAYIFGRGREIIKKNGNGKKKNGETNNGTK